ncbi:hypothetical protein [Micromonospora sp. NPDC005305]|uniref:hypothetical protein n=1 Tax=Micromonospora sp. NPDC005305 TaxID=3156875 RepID=UPI0033A29DAC
MLRRIAGDPSTRLSETGPIGEYLRENAWWEPWRPEPPAAAGNEFISTPQRTRIGPPSGRLVTPITA